MNQASLVVDWTVERRPGIGIVGPYVKWSAERAYRRVYVTAFSGDETADAELHAVDENGDDVRFPRRPRTVREARIEGEAWLYG